MMADAQQYGYGGCGYDSSLLFFFLLLVILFCGGCGYGIGY